MKRIFKYPLKIEDEQTICLPVGARILSLQAQNGVPCIWAIVDDEKKETSPVNVLMFGTGHPISDKEASNRFAGTVQIGGLVLHVFLDYGNDITFLIV